MRLARLAVAGLGVGVLAGFAAALVRPRPHAFPVHPAGAPPTGIPSTQAGFDEFGPAPRDPTNPRPDVVGTAGHDRPPAPAGSVDTPDEVGPADRPTPGSVI